MDYKDTLLLPKTDFPMRANLFENEQKCFLEWNKNSYAYNKMKQRKGANTFNIHDGPPYANGHLHIGHALNKTLKDVILKTHYFNGDSVRWTAGWDCHGLPIEQQVETKMGEAKKTAKKSEIREACKNHADEFVEIQKKEFRSLGVISDFDNCYKTMEYHFEANIYKALCKVAKEGLLIQRSKPVFWSWAAKSALAEAEVEYENKEDYSIFVAFTLDEKSCQKLGVNNAKPVIWTTTPWTLPANKAICLNKDEKYAVTEEGYIFAKKRLDSLKELGITSGVIVKEFLGSDFENLNAINPLNGHNSTLILGEHVTMDGGSGLVHTAPGHGEDDYYVCLKYGIDVVMPVDDGGLYDESLKALMPEERAKELIGVHVFKANEIILDMLGDALLHKSKFIHSYPFCWRTHKPIIYRATKQWFIAMDKPFYEGKTLRELALKAIDEVVFYPQSGKARLAAMIQNRPDWCISRQRDWGVPIAFFRDKITGEPIFDDVIMDNLYKSFKENGVGIWWEEPSESFLKGTDYKAENLEKVYDILDVWFDSGSTHEAVLQSGEYDAGGFKADMYLEGSDQHRGWFQSSLLISCIINKTAPFKSILTHGFTVDSKGEKMSKSKGNVVMPEKVAKDYGVEILRLWVMLSDYTGDLKVGDDILKQTAEQYRKIRNTIRFLLANTNDLEKINTLNFGFLDKWILSRAKAVFDEFDRCSKNYEYSRAYSVLIHFLTSELSGVYLDVCKDRLYCDDKNSQRRVASASAMALIAKKLLTSIAPALTYTVNEALNYAPSVIKNGANDVFDLINEPFSISFEKEDEIYVKSREKFFEIVDVMKKDKTIKSTLELFIYADINGFDDEEIADFYSVSKSFKSKPDEFLHSFKIDEVTFFIALSKENKCQRCWKHSAASDELCPRCKEVLNG